MMTVTPKLIREVRQRSGLDFAVFAKRVGVEARTLESWEAGRAFPQKRFRRSLLKRAKKLGLPSE